MPSLIVQTFPQQVHILDISPYNNFLVTCMVWAEVEGEGVPLKLSINWKKRVKFQTDSSPMVEFFSVPFSEYEVNGPPDNSSMHQSVLWSSETDTENSITYRCLASFEQDDGKHKLKFSDSHISIEGKYTYYHSKQCNLLL